LPWTQDTCGLSNLAPPRTQRQQSLKPS